MQHADQQLIASRKEIDDLKAALDEHAIVAITDPQGRITYVNDKFCAISKYARAELLGQDHRIINSGFHPTEFIRDLWTTITHGKVWKGEIKNKAKDGSFYWVDTTIVPFLDEQGKPRQYVAIRADITERKRVEQEVRQLNADLERRVRERTTELEAANQELEAFSYSVSHDLRAPLRGVDGYVRILKEDYADRLDAEGNRLLEVVSSEARRMGQLIDDLLAFSRLGRQQMQSATIDLAALTRSVFERLTATAPNPTVRLELKSLPSALGDQAMLRQVFANLIGNAVKFTRHQAVPIVEVGGSIRNGELTCYIKDNGVGFDEAYGHKLFGVFQRLHSEADFEGTGVGLALLQRVIQRHGGRVWAEGKLNHGATFYFTLPTKNIPNA
jgi:PAS domain S-box-containing protein